MPDSPTSYFAHAVGFTGETLSPVARRVPGRAICLDVAGHGLSALDEGQVFTWEVAGARILDDIARRQPGAGRRIGFGHSGGGTALLWAEVLAPGTFDALFLYEPPVRAAIPAAMLPPSGIPPLAESVKYRRNSFSGSGDFEDYLRRREPYRSFDEEALAAYVASGLVEDGAGGYTLACAPALEASMYVVPDDGLLERLGEIRAEVVLAQGENTFERFGVMADAVASRLPHARRVTVPGLTHFGPMESPALVADVFRREMHHSADALAAPATCSR